MPNQKYLDKWIPVVRRVHGGTACDGKGLLPDTGRSSREQHERMTLLRIRSGTRRLAVGGALCTAFAAGAAEQAWFAVTDGGGQASRRVEIDLNSLGVPIAWLEAVLRITLPAKRLHESGFAYRSLRAVVRFDCSAAGIQPIAITYFDGPAAAGRSLGAETDLGGGIPPLDLAGGTARMLVKAACGLRSRARLDAEQCTPWNLLPPT